MVAPFYWAEALSDKVEELLSHETEPTVSQLVEVELVSALSRRVRMAEISQAEALAIAARFQADLDNGFYTRLPLEPLHYTTAHNWISQFNTALRTLDALHLAVAASNGIPLITADAALAESAETLGLQIQILRLLNEA